MMMDNRVSITLTEEQKTNIGAAITALKTELGGVLISISNEDKKNLPKISENSLPFIHKVIEYCETDTRFVAPYTDTNELRVDITAFEELFEIYRHLNQFMSQLQDTITLCGSEAYVSSLAYYNTVKLASKMDVPGAKPIYEDLKQKFTKNSHKEEVLV